MAFKSRVFIWTLLILNSFAGIIRHADGISERFVTLLESAGLALSIIALIYIFTRMRATQSTMSPRESTIVSYLMTLGGAMIVYNIYLGF